MSNVDRRTFLKASSVAAGAAYLAPALRASTASAVTPRLIQFEYSQVRLLDGPMLEQFDRNHNFFLGLDEDGLLKPFRERTGMSAPGPVMGGWYNDSPPTTIRQEHDRLHFRP